MFILFNIILDIILFVYIILTKLTILTIIYKKQKKIMFKD
jgi:hypothetical protein